MPIFPENLILQNMQLQTDEQTPHSLVEKESSQRFLTASIAIVRKSFSLIRVLLVPQFLLQFRVQFLFSKTGSILKSFSIFSFRETWLFALNTKQQRYIYESPAIGRFSCPYCPFFSGVLSVKEFHRNRM